MKNETDECNIYDNTINEIMNKFLLEMLEKYSESSIKKCMIYYRQIKRVLCNMSFDEFTFEFILKMGQNTKKQQQGYLRIFISVVSNYPDVEDKILFINNVLKVNSTMPFANIIELTNKSIYKYYFTNIKGYAFIYMDTDIKEIRTAMIYEITIYKNNLSKRKLLFEQFTLSLGKNKINTIYDLSFCTFIEQIEFYKIYDNSSEILSTLKNVYKYLDQTYNLNIFENVRIPLGLLERNKFMNEISNGYEVVHHNRWEAVPISEKWILIYDNSQHTNSSVKKSECTAYDFSNVVSKYRDAFKWYIWNSELGESSKQLYYQNIKFFFRYIEKLEKGEVHSIYCKDKDSGITMGKLIAFREYCRSKYGYGNALSSKIGNIRQFIKTVGSWEKSSWKKELAFVLENVSISEKNTAKALSEEELEELSQIVNQSKYTSEDELHAIIYYLLLTTEFRVSNILALKRDCIKEVFKKNQYVIISKNKVSGKEEVSTPITLEVKRHIDWAIELTSGFAKSAPDNIKSYIFIYNDHHFVEERNVYKFISNNSINKFLKLCVEKTNIKFKVTTSNLRDTHITYAKDYKLKEGLSNNAQLVLTGHTKIKTDQTHYIDENLELQKMLEATNHIIIGDINLQGVIMSSGEKISEENIVEEGCGYCNTEVCDMKSMLGCLMCKHFVTKPDRIPYFEEYIITIDKKIKEAKVPHDKEDCLNIKRLVLGYLKQLYVMKGME